MAAHTLLILYGLLLLQLMRAHPITTPLGCYARVVAPAAKIEMTLHPVESLDSVDCYSTSSRAGAKPSHQSVPAAMLDESSLYGIPLDTAHDFTSVPQCSLAAILQAVETIHRRRCLDDLRSGHDWFRSCTDCIACADNDSPDRFHKAPSDCNAQRKTTGLWRCWRLGVVVRRV